MSATPHRTPHKTAAIFDGAVFISDLPRLTAARWLRAYRMTKRPLEKLQWCTSDGVLVRQYQTGRVVIHSQLYRL